ncbi:MAG: thermonuclease family protein [Thermomicrobiales bacterium]
MTRASPICPRCHRRLAVGAKRCRRCGAVPTASAPESSPAQRAALPWRNQRQYLGTFSLVIGIAVLLGIVGVRVFDADSTPTPVSDRGAVASVTTYASPVITDASPVPAVPRITEDLPALPTPATSPDPAATVAPGDAASPLPILTPFLAATPALEPLRPARVPASAQPATVVDIVEGDVIRVRLGNSEETVRLLGIDTPESPDADGPVECFGSEATDRTAATIPVRTVIWLEADATDRDRSGRLLRYVWFVREANQRTYMLNERLLAEGYAVISTASPSVKYMERFERAQALAQDEGRGLWPVCGGAGTPSTAAP